MDYITHEQYSANVGARCSKDFHIRNINVRVLALMLTEFAQKADGLDHLKKALYYDKVSVLLAQECMVQDMINGEERRDDVGTYIQGGYFGNEDGEELPIILTEQEYQILHAIIGVATEAGELVCSFIQGLSGVQKGETARDDMLDHVNLREEAGDVLWYVQLLLNKIGSSIPECMTVNDRKLEARYGPTFNKEGAINRDLDAERKELEE